MSALRAQRESWAEEPARATPIPFPRPSRLRWWREAGYIAAFYAVYTAIRDIHGQKPVSVAQAAHNATRIISAERFFGIFQEQHVQHVFVHQRAFISFWDVFYGTAHFVVTIAALIWLFRRMPERYPLWRNTLAVTTALALIGFAFYPLMPPRLLPEHYHFVDTLKTIGGLWSFDSGAMQKVSNQFAAMPSLHFAWASWSVLVIAPAFKRPWAKALLWLYPLATLFCIVVTANHFVLDAVGGAVVLGAGYLAARIARTVVTRIRLGQP